MISPRLPVLLASFGVFAGWLGLECDAQMVHYHFYSGVAPFRQGFVVTEPSRTVTHTWNVMPTLPRVSQGFLAMQDPARLQIYDNQGEANRQWCLEMRRRQYDRPSPVFLGTVNLAAQSPPAPDVRDRSPLPTAQIIRWSRVLQSTAFATHRDCIERPLRRWLGGGRQPSPAEYRAMADTGRQMNAVLRELAAVNRITAREYLESAEFLDRLGAEALDRGGRPELASSKK